MKSKQIVLAVLMASATTAFAQSQPLQPRPAPEGRPHHDQVQTREQFLQRAAQRFDSLDLDKDGKISPAERQAARAGHERGERGPERRPPAPNGAPGAVQPPAR